VKNWKIAICHYLLSAIYPQQKFLNPELALASSTGNKPPQPPRPPAQSPTSHYGCLQTHPNIGLTVFAMESLMETLKAPLIEAPKAILTVRLLAFHLAFSTVHLTAIEMDRLKALLIDPSK
jgi:hypothetical protein